MGKLHEKSFDVDAVLFTGTNPPSYVDIQELRRAGNAEANFIPDGILIGINGSDSTQTTAVIRANTISDRRIKTWRLTCGRPHNIPINRIEASGTTGREILILGV